MLSEQELEKSPLFQNINYRDYQEILSCFQAVQRVFRSDELIYDFSTDAVGVVERGQASLIRIDEDGVSTVLEDLGTGGVLGKSLAFAGSTGTVWRSSAVTPARWSSSIIPIFSVSAAMPVSATASWYRTC